MAVAVLLAIGTAAAVVFAVLWHREAGKNIGNAGRPPHHISTVVGAQAPAAAPSTGPPGPRAVVDSYFAAINHRNWPAVWRLGGQNLNASYHGMVDGYASTARDVIRSVVVTGDHATVRVRAYETSGVLQVYQMDFLIQDGIIVHASQRLITTAS